MGISFFHFVTMHTSVRRADGQKGLRYTARCITCSRAVKTARIYSGAITQQIYAYYSIHALKTASSELWRTEATIDLFHYRTDDTDSHSHHMTETIRMFKQSCNYI